jgi:hypothetical protein
MLRAATKVLSHQSRAADKLWIKSLRFGKLKTRRVVTCSTVPQNGDRFLRGFKICRTNYIHKSDIKISEDILSHLYWILQHKSDRYMLHLVRDEVVKLEKIRFKPTDFYNCVSWKGTFNNRQSCLWETKLDMRGILAVTKYGSLAIIGRLCDVLWTYRPQVMKYLFKQIPLLLSEIIFKYIHNFIGILNTFYH